jgi:glycosyltransferase involved in cell wall biosynthesis
MRVSVIIPTYNSGPLVVEAVASVLAQTRPADEIIVVDDGSTDNTAQRLEPVRERIHYVRQANSRVAAARNTGVGLSTGDVIAFLDADDAWHPQKLARQLSVLERRPEIGLLATRVTGLPGPTLPLDGRAEPRVTDLALQNLLVANVLATSSVLVRRSVLDRAGEFDRQLFGPEDYDLWLRCAQVSGVAVLDEPLTAYRDTYGSLGKQADTMRRGLLAIHAKLEVAGVWKGRWWLRRKSTAHIDYTTGFLMFAAGRSGSAARLLVSSLLRYPVPMSRAEVRYPCGRLRLLLRAAIGSCHSFLGRRREMSSVLSDADTAATP